MAVTTVAQDQRRSRRLALVLSVLFGLGGADHFYLGKTRTGLLKLVTLGGMGLWWLADVFRVARGNVSGAEGLALEETAEEVDGRTWAQWLALGSVSMGAFLALVFLLAAFVRGSGGYPEAVMDFPQVTVLPIRGWIDDAVDWLTVGWRYELSRGFSDRLLWLLVRLERFFLWLPWWSVLLSTGLVAWRISGLRVATGAVLGMLFVGAMGLWDKAMQTLALMATATLVAVAIGIPLGIAAAKSDTADSLMRPILDAMQTMPSFVYLIPALMLFGLGKVPALIATVIYAVPPSIRLTNLGIRLVDPEVVEAARSFGTTGWQLLLKVQLPLALPNIMAGINQTVMMALAMAVIASLVGAKGLGAEVLKGIARLEMGTGLLAGVAIVVIAMIIDRISQGLARSQRTGAQRESA